MDSPQSKGSIGVEQAPLSAVDMARTIIVAGAPESARRQQYEAKRHRFGYPRITMATISQVREVLRCTGCPVRVTKGLRVIDVRPDCPVHGWEEEA